MNNLFQQLEQWNDADEFTKCIEAIEAIPKDQWDYRITFALARALENYAIIGDHDKGTPRGKGTKALLRAIDMLESVREEGEGKAEWNMRMAYAYQYLSAQEEKAIPYAQRWAELDPGDKNAEMVIQECREEIQKRKQREWITRLDLYDQDETEAVEAHIETHFGKFDWVMHETVPGEYIHLDICVIPPREEHNYYTLVTMGMGAYTMNAPEKDEARVELLLNLPPDWNLGEDAWEDEHWFWPVGILKALARYPMLHDTWFGWGHTVYGSEESYTDNTRLCGVILLNPGVFGDPASVCTLPGGEKVHFYQVIPLYREEIEFRREYDVDRLLEKFPDELLEVIDPARPNAITDAEAIAYDDALMDEAEPYLAIIQDKQLPVEELAAYNHLAIYLRWCMEHDLMSVPFLAKHRDVAEAVKGGQVPDLRAFLQNSEDLQGRLHLTYFNREGTEFARWYSWGSRATPYNYNKDIAAHAKAHFGDDSYGSETYLFVPWDERYYQEMAEIISQRFAQWEALEENQEPEKKLCIKPEDIKSLLPDWDGPRDCFVSDRIMVDGCKVGECYRLEPDRGDEGWDSGWTFLAGDEDEEYADDRQNFGIYDINTLCNYDPDVIPFLSMPAGTWLARAEDDGQFYIYKDEEEDDSGIPFWFDVSADLTGDEQAMAAVASALEEADKLAEKSKAFLKGVLANEDSEYYGIVSCFLEFHRDELEEDAVKELFSTEDPSALTLTEMVDHLQLNRFGSFLDEKTKQQMFIMDLTFDPEITDELLVIYFNLDRQIVNISHES